MIPYAPDTVHAQTQRRIYLHLQQNLLKVAGLLFFVTQVANWRNAKVKMRVVILGYLGFVAVL